MGDKDLQFYIGHSSAEPLITANGRVMAANRLLAWKIETDEEMERMRTDQL